ncbi:MAG: hypothetical protein ACYCST_00415 [Acidimicrobiales bacterium]
MALRGWWLGTAVRGAVSAWTPVAPRACLARVVTVAEEATLATAFLGSGKHSGDAGNWLVRPEYLDTARGRLLVFGRQHLDNCDPVYLDLSLDAKDVADLGTLGQQGRRDYPPGLEGSSGPPGEGLVVAGARELYIHAV